MGEFGAPATWLIALLVALLALSPLAVGVVNRRFTKRERQPVRGLKVGAHPLSATEVAYLKGLARDVQSYQESRGRKFMTGYVARIGENAVACRSYRFGRQGAYVGVADLRAAAPTLEYRAGPLHIALRLVVLGIVAALALILDVPWWLVPVLIALVAWVFWFDHRNEMADQVAHVKTVMQQAAPAALGVKFNKPTPRAAARKR